MPAGKIPATDCLLKSLRSWSGIQYKSQKAKNGSNFSSAFKIFVNDKCKCAVSSPNTARLAWKQNSMWMSSDSYGISNRKGGSDGCLVRTGTSSEACEMCVFLSSASQRAQWLLCMHVHCLQNSDLAVLNLRKSAAKKSEHVLAKEKNWNLNVPKVKQGKKLTIINLE